MAIRSAALYTNFCRVTWVAAVFFLPVSSLPLLASLAHASSVAPVTTFLLSFLALVWLVPYLVKGGRIPSDSVPLVWFVWAALFSLALAWFREIPSFQNASLWGEARSALITLMMGMAVFFTTASWTAQPGNSLKTTLRVVHLSSLPMFAWSAVQAYFVMFHASDYPEIVFQIQGLISSSNASLYIGRVTGLAFEPSWLAHQLNMVYLPIWLASSLTGISVFRRIAKISVENILLVLGCMALLISFSRVGWISFAFALALVVLWVLVRVTAWVQARFLAKIQGPGRMLYRWLIFIGLMAGFLLLGAAASVVLFRIGMYFDPRLGRILEHSPLDAENMYDFANRIFIGERMVYWAAGVGVFNSFPIFGAGLGTAGFYFYEKLPAFAYGLTEVQNLLYRLGAGFNIKSLWVRLLAETGILGFSMFLGWYAGLFRAAGRALKSLDPEVRLIGYAGLLMLVGFLAEGFSVDSFALPYFWFAAGLLAAAAALARQTASRVELS